MRTQRQKCAALKAAGAIMTRALHLVALITAAVSSGERASHVDCDVVQPAAYKAAVDALVLGRLSPEQFDPRQSVVDLSLCVNLAPAGTGTSTLCALLRNHSKLTHHLHTVRAKSYRVTHYAKCFILTVRDPVARVKSAYTWEMSRASGRPFASADRSLSTPSEFVRAIQNASHRAHAAARSLYYRSLQGQYYDNAANSSKNFHTPFYKTLAANTIIGGAHHLVPQSD